MSRRGRIMFAFALAIMAGIFGWGWWVNFHQKTYEATLIVQAQHERLDEIQRIATANKHSCRWNIQSFPSQPSRAAPPHAPPTARDIEDSRRILADASAVGMGSLEIDCDESLNEPPVIRVWIFDAGLMPWAKPVYAFSAPAGSGVIRQAPGGGFMSEAQGCDAIEGTQWYVCEGKWVFL